MSHAAEKQLNVFLVWGIVAAVATVIAKRTLKLGGRNLLVRFETENVGVKDGALRRTNPEYEALTKLILELEAWDEVKVLKNVISFPGGAKQSTIEKLINRLRINLSPAPLRLAIERRTLARDLSKHYDQITCISSDNLNDWKYFYDNAFKQHIVVEHGSLLYRQYITKKQNTDTLAGRFKSLLIAAKFRLNLARDIRPSKVLSLVRFDDGHVGIQTEREGYRSLVDDFFRAYEMRYPNEFEELKRARLQFGDRQVCLFGPYVEAVPHYTLPVLKRGLKYVSEEDRVVIIKKHPSDNFEGYVALCERCGYSGFEFLHPLNRMIPVEFLLWFFESARYVGSPTIGAMYARTLLGKRTTVFDSGVAEIDQLYEREYGSIRQFM